MRNFTPKFNIFIDYLFPSDVIETALLSKDVDGTLYELLKMLMSAIFKMQDEEEEDEKLDLEEHGVSAPSGKEVLLMKDFVVLCVLRYASVLELSGFQKICKEFLDFMKFYPAQFRKVYFSRKVWLCLAYKCTKLLHAHAQ